MLACAAAALHAQVVNPTLVRGSTADVLVLAGMRDQAADQARLARLVTACRVAMEISPTDSVGFVTWQPPAPALDVWQLRDAVVISVLPRQDLFIDCDDAAAQATLAASRGLRVTLDPTYSASRDVAQVIVRRGDRVLTPLVSEKHPGGPLLKFGHPVRWQLRLIECLFEQRLDDGDGIAGSRVDILIFTKWLWPAGN